MAPEDTNTTNATKDFEIEKPKECSHNDQQQQNRCSRGESRYEQI